MTIIINGKDHGYNALGRYDLEYLLHLFILASIVYGEWKTGSVSGLLRQRNSVYNKPHVEGIQEAPYISN
jgi:hypothetical protein